jgi:hypothetical protein
VNHRIHHPPPLYGHNPLSISVNLGGLFVLEPFITPALFQKYNLPPDEWHLSLNMAAANGSLAPLEDHYNTFIVSSFL